MDFARLKSKWMLGRSCLVQVPKKSSSKATLNEAGDVASELDERGTKRKIVYSSFLIWSHLFSFPSLEAREFALAS